ncbi:acidic mammalian chitinase-like [Durio zibethinus]|uniref:Acidic mammalian chitinase-like n=1 Tax=Durio zibethinus TaxID=66656 RepID=A0A6P5XKD7_DURZI|nr:acidic mammalian chitinase-like [Durio zibethinus]
MADYSTSLLISDAKIKMYVSYVVYICLLLHPSLAQTWMQAGYWSSGSEFPISDIKSALFTHLICAFANLNSSSYQLPISSDGELNFFVFTNTVKQKNPSITTLLSVGGESANRSIIVSMVSNSYHRKSCIDSSIKTARLYGFQGLDFCWVSANTNSDMSNMALLFEEWRAAIDSEARNSSQSELILTATVPYSRYSQSLTYPVDSLKRNLNWLHILVSSWINGGLPATKLVLGLPFYGYSWTLVDPKDNTIGAPASGPAKSEDGVWLFKDIRNYIQRNGANSVYNGTYVVNYCTVGKTWNGFDDVEVVKIKVSYAKEKKVLGYFVWQVPFDDNWMLSQAASASANADNPQKKGRLLLINILIPIVVLLLLVGALAYYLLRVKRKREGKTFELELISIIA